MATLSIPYGNFVNGTAADGDQVDANIEAIRQFVQTSVVHVDGANSFTAYPTLPGSSPASSNQAASKGYVDANVGQRLMVANAGQHRSLFGTSVVTTNGSGQASVTFSTPFPQTCVGVILSATSAIAVGATGATTAGFTVVGPNSSTFTVAWMAIGT